MIKKSMLESLAALFFCCLCVSVLFNIIGFVHLVQLRDYRLEYGFLAEEYERLQESYDELREAYSPKPPISKSEAIDIALEYGGWNETTLKGMEVTATLEYVMFHNSSCGGVGFSPLHDVTVHVSDYSPYEACFYQNHYLYDCITHRYVWRVIVHKAEGVRSIPPPGHYFVDASTGEVIPHDL